MSFFLSWSSSLPVLLILDVLKNNLNLASSVGSANLDAIYEFILYYIYIYIYIHIHIFVAWALARNLPFHVPQRTMFLITLLDNVLVFSKKKMRPNSSMLSLCGG